MNTNQIKGLKKTLGKMTFGLFFPNENKRLAKTPIVTSTPVEETVVETVEGETTKDLILVNVAAGKQTVAVKHLRALTNWTVKKATSFIKEGEYPKVVISNSQITDSVTQVIAEAREVGVIFEIV